MDNVATTGSFVGDDGYGVLKLPGERGVLGLEELLPLSLFIFMRM